MRPPPSKYKMAPLQLLPISFSLELQRFPPLLTYSQWIYKKLLNLFVYLFLLTVEVCMSETCSCTYDIFVKTDSLMLKESDWCKQPHWMFTLFYFPVGPHLLSHSTGKEDGPFKYEGKEV